MASCMARYLWNRNKLQIVSNYLGMLFCLYFALEGLSTNWAGTARDDPTLQDSVKVRCQHTQTARTNSTRYTALLRVNA